MSHSLLASSLRFGFQAASAKTVVVDGVLSQVNDLVDLSAPDGHNEGVMRVPPKVKVEAVPAARHEFSPLASGRLRRWHPDAGTTFGHETGRTGLEVRQPAGRIVDRVGG